MNQHRPSPHRQRGAALAVALILLIVLTLLGVAAVRTTQTELRLAQNAESRSTARQQAESLISVVLSDDKNTPVNDDAGYRACWRATPAPPAAQSATTCQNSTRSYETQVRAPGTSGVNESNQVPKAVFDFGYVDVVRQLPLFVSIQVLREAQTSGRGYDFARYTVTAGFDRTTEGRSAAEVTESRLILHNKIAGVNYE